MVRIGSGALLALALAGCAPRPESTPMVNDPVPVVWTALRQADARKLLVDAGARIESETQTAENGWLITAEVPDGLPVTWKGMQCQGDGPDRACTEYKIEVALKTASPQAAQALAASRDILFPADTAVGDEYIVWRMGFTYGGVTRAYLKNTLAVTIDMGFAAAKEIGAAGKA
jgi:hypothetical protein